MSSRTRQARDDASSEAQVAAIDAVLQQAQARAKSCEPGGTPAGATELTVTFAPNGKVSAAELDGSAANESLRECILEHVRALEIPAFEGASIQVQRQITIGQ